MLAALLTATFLVNISAIGISPFLLDIAQDLGTDLAAAGNLVAANSISWGIASLLAGFTSDRLGRRPILIGGLIALALSPIGVALTATYLVAALWRTFGGSGGGAYMGTVFATVSDHFPAAERGRALGTIVTGQSLSLVVGVPLVTYAGGILGWRGALAVQGILLLLSAALVWSALPRTARRTAAVGLPARAILQLMTPRIVALFVANTTERFVYGGVAVYLATFLLTTYGISFDVLALGLAVIASGNLLGNVVGGELTDRVPSRPLLAAMSLAVTAGLALPLLTWQPGLIVTLGLGFAYTFVGALGRPALLTLVSEVSNEARGTLLGLNITFSSFGWLGASAIGGWLITSYGFAELGWVTAGASMFGAVLALMSSRSGARVVRPAEA
ncbi:MAG: MFS transporter [Chloroflexi bacterium]|nr:MFS transporter [Chloroflexota bacterium]